MGAGRPRFCTILRDAWHNNRVDAATGLPDRESVERELRRFLAAGKAERGALLIVSVDRLNAVRDGYGGVFGQEVLREAAARIIRESGERLTGYLGADEFAVLVGGSRPGSQAASIARRLLERLEEPFSVAGQRIYCGASVGIARYPEDGADADSLMRHAAVALSHGRAARGERLAFFNSRMRARATGRVQLESELRAALEGEQFMLHYQPRFGCSGGAPVGFEALLRWRHPERGVLAPAEFIEVLEESGAISAVGEWVLRRACRQLMQWRGEGLEAVPVAVNLSASQFRKPGLEKLVARIVEETGVDASLVEIEITESSLVHDPEDAVRTLRGLESLGMRISVDDFGTGYSSLAYLRRFPLHALKMDRAFVHDATASRDGAAIARAIVQLAHALRLRVTAEGVETEEQRELLLALGCDEMQGFLFAPALSAEDAAALLARGR